MYMDTGNVKGMEADGMEVRNCRGCGRLFSYIEGGSYLCPACQEELEEKFQVAKAYIRENKNASIHEVAEAADVSVKQIEKWVREERLAFADDSPVGIACEKCGAMIRSGRFCEACKASMANHFSELYEEPKKVEAVKKDVRDSARMRFLNKQS